VSDAADLVVALFDDGSVYLLSGDASAQFITRVGTPAGIGFLPDQSSLAIADGTSGLVSIMDGIAGSLATRASANAGSISGSLVLISPTLDGRALLVAGLGSTSIARINLNDLTVSLISVASSVSRIDRFGRGNEFLFSGASPDTALWMLAAGGPELQTAFAQPSISSASALATALPPVEPAVRGAGRN
jgi:hypothetical protein